MWIDIVSIMFVCVTMNHLGLVKAAENILRKELPIVNCPKCFTFWSVLAYELWAVANYNFPQILAVSFISSYAAIWLELIEGYIDSLYMMFYEKIYANSDNGTPPSTKDDADS